MWLSSSAADAQTPTAIDDARAGARLHIGGLYVTPTFQLKELGLDSNVLNQSGEQTPDFTFTLSPGATLAVPIAHRALLAGHVDTDLVYYQKYSSQRSINPNVAMRATLFLHRLTLFADGSYLNTRERVNQEIDARARRISSSVSGGFNLRLVPKVSFGLTGQISRTDYAEDQIYHRVDLREALAADTKSVSAHINYVATPLTTFVLTGGADETRFLFSPQKDADSFRVMPGVEFKPRALVSGSAYLGFRRFQPKDALVPEFTGPVAQLSLRYSLRAATTFSTSLDRDVAYSYQALEPYFVSTGFGVSVRRQLVGPFDATVGFQIFHYRYQDLLPLAAVATTKRVDTTTNYSGDMGYRVSRKGRLGVGLSYWQRESNRDLQVAYNGLRFGCTFSYGT